jgi:hypothetical protein
MSAPSPNPSETKMLPEPGAARSTASPAPTSPPPRQLSDLPRDELDNLAEEYGVDPTSCRSRQHLVAAIHERRQLIASMDRDAMLDVVIWGRRPVSINASKEQLAYEIARCRSMRFSGLSHRGLLVLAQMRGVRLRGDESVPALVKRLRKQEGLFSRLNRKRRAMLGAFVSNLIGERSDEEDYRFLPPQQGQPGTTTSAPGASPISAQRQASIKDEIEDAGLIGGITGRIRKSADTYLNQKLDEIEARIDRKLDEIDRRLAEWRDKEIANRLRILKITLWASVIVGAVSLIYSYIKVYFL